MNKDKTTNLRMKHKTHHVQMKDKKSSRKTPSHYSDLTVIIPTLNEEKNIVPLVKDIVKLYPRIRVIVCDDGSKDKTQQLVRILSKTYREVRLLDRSGKKQKGLTASVINGILESTTRYIAVIDGDRQHPIETIGEMYSLLKKPARSHSDDRESIGESIDIVVANRIKIIDNWPAYRRLISIAATGMAHARLMLRGISIKDPMSGFFAMKTSLAKKIISLHGMKFEYAGYKVLFDMLKYAGKNVRTGNVGYVFGNRKHGNSKISKKHVWLFLRSVFR